MWNKVKDKLIEIASAVTAGIIVIPVVALMFLAPITLVFACIKFIMNMFGV